MDINSITYIEFRDKGSNLEVLNYDKDKELLNCLEVTDPFEYTFNDYYDEYSLTKFNDDVFYSIDEFFLFEGELYRVDEYCAPTGTIFARKVLRAVSVSPFDVESKDVHGCILHYILDEEVIISNE